MAGIGFRLTHLLRSRDPAHKLGGVLLSILISCGPWLCTVIAIGLISLLVLRGAEVREHTIFRIIVNYTYAASLVLFGLIEMVATRYVADALFVREERVIPTLFVRIVWAVLTATTVVGGVFYSFSNLDFATSVAATVMLGAVTVVWCAMVFLSACKDYIAIAWSFVVGMGTSVILVWLLGRAMQWGLLGSVVGFAMGQTVIAVALGYRIFREFGVSVMSPRDFMSYIVKKRIFILVGVLYALAIWIDKTIFWLSPITGEHVESVFYKSSAYDSGIFLSYLTIVPAMAWFLVRVETRFYISYRRYFALIDHHVPHSVLEQARRELILLLKSEARDVFIFQALIAGVAIVLSDMILGLIGLPALYVTVFRYGVVAAAFHAFLLFANLLILYFDRPRMVALNYGLFFTLNTWLSWRSTHLDYRFYGLGYAIAALATTVVTVICLNRVLKDLHAHVFMSQPIARPSYLGVGLANPELSGRSQ